MFSDLDATLIQRITAAPIERDPFPHCIIDNIFPDEFYEALLEHWPAADLFGSQANTGRVTSGAYKERMVFEFAPERLARLDDARREFWRQVLHMLLDFRLNRSILDKFHDDIATRFFPQEIPTEAIGDSRLISDRIGYAIGPHTDAPSRLVSLLFYLPTDSRLKHRGTSLYRPIVANFRSDDGRHHPFHLFHRIRTVDFVPNRLLLFPKTDRSFHGVERIEDLGTVRRLLSYNIHRAA